MVWVELVYGTQWNTFAVVYVVDNLMFNLFEFHGSGSINVCDLSLIISHKCQDHKQIVVPALFKQRCMQNRFHG